jgi:L-malate glycosyltransferase
VSKVEITFCIGSLAIGGAENQLLELLRKIDRSRFAPSLVLFEDKTSSRASGLVEHFYSLDIPSSGNSNWRMRGTKATAALFRLSSHLRRHRPAILHAYLPAACILAAPAAKLARIPIVIGSRRSMVSSYRTGNILDHVDRVTTRLCTSVVGNSKAVSNELVTIDGVPTERVTTIYNGVDTLRFRPADRSLRKEYGWKDDNIVFGVVANFIPYKRHIDFVRAAADIAAQEPLARFVMAGEDRGQLTPLLRQIEQFRLQDKFTVIRGATEPERLYPSLDVYVCCSETEGLSNVLLEASACGLPIIATRTGGNAEVVRDGQSGFVVEAHDWAAMAERGIILIRNPDLRKSMGSSGRQFTEVNFSVSAMVHNYELLYERLLVGSI